MKSTHLGEALTATLLFGLLGAAYLVGFYGDFVVPPAAPYHDASLDLTTQPASPDPALRLADQAFLNEDPVPPLNPEP